MLLSIPVLAALAIAQYVEPEAMTLRLFEGDQDGDYFGWLAANIPDVDADGVQEVIIPAIAYDNFAGRATVYSGATGQILNDVFGGAGQAYGYSAAAAGDVDADGVDDYIIGGGRVDVYSGATHSVLWNLRPLTGFGHCVSGAGDIDGDGHGDLIVGSERTSSTTTAAGRISVVSGASAGLIWSRDGTTPFQLLGSGCGTIGDIDFDGVPDVIAGASGGSVAYILSGADGEIIHTLLPDDPANAGAFGRFFASGAGDVDRDGIGDAFIGDYAAFARNAEGTGHAYIFSGRTGERLHLFTGVNPGDGFGVGRGIPDVNGDSHADLLIAAYTNSDGAPAAGKTYLYSGRSGALLRTITATLEGDNFGVDAIGMGDTNDDGLDDFLITACGLAFAGLDHGRAYLVAGTELGCPADLTGNDRVNAADLLRLLRAIQAQDPEADLGGDGDGDFDDVIVLLKDWGRCH
jgi:hypothetical protein